MKGFLKSTVAAGIALSMLGAPLAMAEVQQTAPEQHLPAPSSANHPPPPHVAEQHVAPQHANPPPPPHKVVNNTTVQHTTIVHNTTNYNEVHNSYPAQPGPPPHQYVYSSGHQWHHGDYYNGNRYYVSNWQQYHLYQPPAGYQWVQDGGQFVLIAVASGIITDVILNAAYQ